MVPAYRARRDALCAAAAESLGAWFEWEVPPGGMFVWMRATHPGIDTNALYTHALAENVAFVPSSVFDPSGELRSAMRLNFTRNPPEVLAEGVSRLARAVRRYLRRMTGRRASSSPVSCRRSPPSPFETDTTPSSMASTVY